MSRTRWGALFPLLLVGCVICGCAGKSSQPVSPSGIPVSEATGYAAGQSGPDGTGHYLMGWYWGSVDENLTDWRIVPVRQASFHLNALMFLEKTPCGDCVKITHVEPGPSGSVQIDVSIRHPFANLNLTAFDVRGIVMFNGSRLFPASGLRMSDSTMGDGELLNADGYTTLYNPTTIGHAPLEGYTKGKMATSVFPDATLNGYKRHVTDNPANTRNALYAGDTVEVTYIVKVPAPFVFGYAVDANWAPPLKTPVVDPMTDFGPGANCPEPWRLDVVDSGPGLTVSGGTTDLVIDVYDRQGPFSVSAPAVECPELFDGFVNATFKLDGADYSRWEASLSNPKHAPAGQYRCLVRVEDSKNDPINKPWMDLSAYQVATLQVGEEETEFNPVDVTPPWLNFSPTDLCVAGTYLYVAAGVNGFHIFDISTPLEPEWVNKVETSGSAEHVAVSGQYAYVAENEAGMEIIDISDPESAHIENIVVTPVGCMGADASEGYAYLACYDSLVIVDVHDPQSPFIVQTVPVAARCVTVSDGHAYVGRAESLSIVDINPPESASVVSTVQFTGNIHDIALKDGYAFAASQWASLVVVDVDPPASAHVVEWGIGPEAGVSVEVAGDYVCMAVGWSGLWIFDASDPESTHWIAELDTPDWARSVDVSGSTVYVGTGCELVVVDGSVPESPYVANSLLTPGGDSLSVIDGYAYMGIYGYGLEIVDIDPQESARVVSGVPTPGYTNDVAASGGYAYVADEGSKLQIIDANPPQDAHIVSSPETYVNLNYVTAAGGFAYVGDDGEMYAALGIVDCIPPDSAHSVATVPYAAGEIAVSWPYLYTAGGPLNIVNINPPETANVVMSLEFAPSYQSRAVSVAVSGGYAFVVEWNKGIYAVDIDPPDQAQVVNSIHMPYHAERITVSAGYAYVADPSDGLVIIDVDPPEAMNIVMTIPVPGAAYDVAVVDGFAYVADGWGLRIIKLW